MRRTLLLLLIGWGMVALGGGAREADDAPKVPKSSTVRRALAKRDRVLDQAEAAYRKTAAEANKALLVGLKKAKDAAHQAKDLDEANAVAALIEKTERELEAPVAGKGRAMAGPWLISWSNGGTFRYEFNSDATAVTDGAFKTIKVERAGDARAYWLAGPGGNHVHRYRPAGEYLVAEMWHDAAEIARGDRPTQIGVGRRGE